MYKNLRKLRESLNMTQKEFAASLGIGLTTYNGYETGAREPKSNFWISVADKYDVTVDYLMGYSATPAPPPSVTDDVVSFPVIGDLAAGYEHIAYEDWEAGRIDLPRRYLKGRRPDNYFVLRVKGDSMFPQYQDGDVVLVLKQTTLNRSGEVGVVIYDDEHATLKKVEYVMGEDWMRLIPLNPQYPPVMITGEDLEHCRVLGLPVLLIRKIEQ